MSVRSLCLCGGSGHKTSLMERPRQAGPARPKVPNVWGHHISPCMWITRCRATANLLCGHRKDVVLRGESKVELDATRIWGLAFVIVEMRMGDGDLCSMGFRFVPPGVRIWGLCEHRRLCIWIPKGYMQLVIPFISIPGTPFGSCGNQL